MGVVRVVTAFIIGLLIFQHSRPAAHASYSVKNRIITNPTVSGRLLPWGTGRIASVGGRSAFLYRVESGDWLYMYDGSGNESHIPLPDRFDLNDRANAEYILTTPTDLWIWSGVLGRTALRHYRLLGSGSSRLPDKAFRVSVTSVGDEDTRPGALLKLADGGVLAVWYQFRYQPDRRLNIGIVYVNSSGGITTNYPISAPGMEGTPVATRWAMAQHPADGSIWAFFKRDSYHEISALHLTVSAQGIIKLDWIRPDFIGRKDGGHEPEGEYPYLAVVADSANDTLVLAYQNKRYEFLYVTDGDGNFLSGSCGQDPSRRMEPYFFAKRSMVSIVRLTADGKKDYQDFSGFVERTQEFGLTVTDRLWILYRRIDCEASNYQMLQRQGEVMLSYHYGKWGKPLIIGSLDTEKEYYAASLFSSPHQPHFLMRLDDGLLHLFLVTPDI